MLKVQGAASSSQGTTRAVTGPDPQVGRTVPFSGSRALSDGFVMTVNPGLGRWVAGLSMVVLLAACTRSTEPAADTRSTVGPTVSAPASATAGAERGAPLDTLPFPEPAGGGLTAAQQQALRAALDQVSQPSASGVIRGVSMADIASITKTVTAAEIMFLAPPLGLGGVPVPRRAPWPDGCEELRAMPRLVVESS